MSVPEGVANDGQSELLDGSYDFLFKLLVVGDSGVGKTACISRFVDDTFSNNLVATCGVDFSVRLVDLPNGKRVKLQIWDTAGQERFRTITKQFYRGAMGIVLMYDVTNKDSYLHVRQWVDDVHKHAQDNVKLLLVGNKTDLSNRAILHARGQKLAADFGIEFIETSAATGDNVGEAFESLINGVYKNMADGSLLPPSAPSEADTVRPSAEHGVDSASGGGGGDGGGGCAC